MTTYSVGLYGSLAGQAFVPAKQAELPDADSSNTACAVTAGAMAGTMQTGAQVLAKMPDGSQRWCTIDPERSTFAKPVLLPVGP